VDGPASGLPNKIIGYLRRMSLNNDAQVDTSQVEDQRGGSGGGLGGLPIPSGRGGIVGLIVGVIVLLAGGGYGASQVLGGGSGQPDNGNLNQECATSNPDRLSNVDCRNVLYINSIQSFWQTETPSVYHRSYQKSDTVFFQQQVQTGCGAADTGVGPFYCPTDRKVYIDLSFYDELTSQFGATGEFTQAYVLAHEYGHHIQDLVGTMSKVSSAEQGQPDSANKYSVMLELQADCLAGVWAKHATETKDASGHAIFTAVSQQDIHDAVHAAGTIGDDAIQKKAGQRVNQDSFTHGSSAQREQWLSQGYKTGEPGSCDTFGRSLG
jgi:predicted metalloprotease